LPAAAALQALTPQITENKRKTEDLLREAYTLQTCLAQKVAGSVLEKLLPKRYKQYNKGIGAKA
jgi:MoxR-like ATPase